jgi:enediyne biosynthesis protein E4
MSPRTRANGAACLRRRLAELGACGFLLLTGLSGCDRSIEAPGHLDWVQEDGYRWAALRVAPSERVGFEPLPGDRTGIGFRNAIAEDDVAENRGLVNGSGVAIGDVTGNGFSDVYFARLDGSNVLYENLGGYRFRDITAESGVALPDQFSSGAVFSDLNGDGHLDLVVTSLTSPNRLFFNDGSGRFTERVGGLPALRNHGSSSVAVADLTGNGTMDLYVANYKPRSARDMFPREMAPRFIIEEVDGEVRITERFRDHYAIEWVGDEPLWYETGEGDLLYLNDGDGNFEPAPLDSGILLSEDGTPITEELRDWGLHARIQDMSGNGLPDIYVANDFNTPDRIWMNQGDGTFRALDRLALRKNSFSSMAVDFGDLDRDGHLDFLVVEMLSPDHGTRLRQAETRIVAPHPVGSIENRPLYSGNTLFKGREDGTWAEISEFAGLRRSGWSWSTFFLDVNLNGLEDILITNGHYADVQDFDTNMQAQQLVAEGRIDISRAMLVAPSLRQRNVAYRNEGAFSFDEVGEQWGFTEDDISNGMALGDLNNNGVLDLVVNRLGDDALVLRNLTDRPRVQVRLKDRAPNTAAIGAKIRFLGGPHPQYKEVIGGGAYLSSSTNQYAFATGDASGPFTIEIDWRDGTRSRLDGIETNRVYEIDGRSIPRSEPERESPEPDPLFDGGEDALSHTHHDPAFEGEGRQPLLPWSLGQEGPAIAWFDWTGSGFPDLFIGSGRGGDLTLFENRNGTLGQVSFPGPASDTPLDQAGIVGFAGEDGARHLLVGLSSYEGEIGEDSRVLHYRNDEGGVTLHQEIRIPGVGLGPLAVADYTGNGAPDLFVGGRMVPGRYPEAGPSYLFRNEGGIFELDEPNSSRLEDFGLVVGAVFSDLDGDGSPELILATDWGPVRVLSFADGALAERTAEFGLDQYPGWWRGVATGDLTGNGLPDIVATNRGLNFWGRNVPDQRQRLYHGDFNRNGFLDLIEAYRDESIGGWVPRRPAQDLGQSMPFIGRQFSTVEEYSRMTVREILGPMADQASYVEAHTLEHMVFLNDGGVLHPRPLPDAAQFAPGFGVVVADFDGDGHQDVFLGQNFFHDEPDTPRSDAGRGLLMRGDGSGGLAPVTGGESGIRVYGEQRGVAAADLDGDGRLDLVVSQNGADTRLFRNRRAVPGISLRLAGSVRNPDAVGATARLVFEGDELGPIHEVQIGSGFWSQQPSRLLLTPGDRVPVAVLVRWPDGEESLRPLEPGERAITVSRSDVP